MLVGDFSLIGVSTLVFQYFDIHLLIVQLSL